jgi:hypothetical protein
MELVLIFYIFDFHRSQVALKHDISRDRLVVIQYEEFVDWDFDL